MKWGDLMNERYREEDYLMISGIQHFAFCRRQWALIHIEQQWQENLRTVEGKIVHDRCHDEKFTEKRGDLLICRGMRVFSSRMGISGQCDVVEFSQGETGAFLWGRKGLWRPCPVEYKRGKPKQNSSDSLQLCAQAMCLEEMLCCEIREAFLFYDEIHRREKVILTNELRDEVEKSFIEMHEYYTRGYTPRVKSGKKCNSCSLKDLCLPKLSRKKSVNDYYQEYAEDM